MWCEMAAMIGALVVGDLGDPASIRPGEFEGWFRSAERGELEVPSAVARRARSYRYVFVGGFHNERMPGYFAQNRAELRALGVPKRAIHVISPRSDRTSEENAEEIRGRFREIADEGPERLVVIAHSRGACDSLAFAVANAPFVKDRVEALFLIQGPFGGSGAAEYAVGRGEPMDRRMAWRHRVLGRLAAWAARGMARRVGLDVLEGMTREGSRAFWKRALEEHAAGLSVVGARTYYVRSSIHPSRLRFVRRAIGWYLQIYHGPSDGMVALADQMLPALGTVVATLEAGHSDLTHRYPASRAPRSMRRALIRSIVMAVGRPGPASTARGGIPPGPARVPISASGGAQIDLGEHAAPEGRPCLPGEPGVATPDGPGVIGRPGPIGKGRRSWRPRRRSDSGSRRSR